LSQQPSPNFAYLAHHDPRLVALGTQAEEHFAADPEVSLFKLRKFGELLAKRAAAKVSMFVDGREQQIDIVNRLHERGVVGATQRTLFHDLRKSGNLAVHEFDPVAQSEALHQLKMARELAVWFQRSFGNDRKFDPGPFVPPPDPKKKSDAVHAELERLRAVAAAHEAQVQAGKAEIERLRQQAEDEAKRRLTAEERAAREADERAIWEALAAEQSEQSAAENAKLREALAAQDAQLMAELAAQQTEAEAAPDSEIQTRIDRSAAASEAIALDEAATRRLIDKQLRDAGWEVDSEALTFGKGVKPIKGHNLAIAEWPTDTGPADYVLFLGERAVAVVEAKRQMKDIPGSIAQAKRYSRGYRPHGHYPPVDGGPWDKYRVPFLFATNGRPYLRQLETKSGIWFLDARRNSNISTALEGWYTPEGLRERLKLDVDAAHEQLEREPTDYLGLRDYQLDAIAAIEKGLAAGRRELLVAMATGTGKTRTCIGLVYRLLKTRRFRRVLFLVDRSALGEQATGALEDMRLENLQTFTDIFDIKKLGDMEPEPDTRMQLATIQSMVSRIIGPHDEVSEARIPPIDAYDCIVVDECHRGYLLDRELSDHEMTFRDEADYISKYRRVLDHFDAVKIGLTATPALHTSEIFGAPTFEYSYREAVIDGYLVDHEPPIRIVTQLAEDGISWKAGEEVLVLERGANVIEKSKLADDVNVEIDAFNKKVITENFNRAVLGELAKHIDPEDDEKTLIFCASDEHCDLVVTLFKQALMQQYGGVDDDAVVKITGKADKPLELIRRYRNERQPSIAVTVDLLTTGIDVPPIANLVFLRRVRSRILYEQMLGRATRLCPDIGKERFRIFDAVDLYAAIADATDMKPVVVNPTVTFEQLIHELVEVNDESTRRDVLDELLAKLQRKKRHLHGSAADEFVAAAGVDPKELVKQLKAGDASQAAAWFVDHHELGALLDRKTGGGPQYQLISQHHDEVREVTHGYGAAKRPEDYIESFRAYITSNLNKIPALLVVTQRPKELTRQQLKELKLALDREGYSETKLRTAWRESKNEDLAASIIGYIRQMALGKPLMSYEARVEQAMQRILKSRPWTAPQRKWLDRIGSQLEQETVVDRDALDHGEFKSHGGFARLNKVFDGELEQLLEQIQDEVWKEGA
jgi:type I restriction enzyme R subunit